MKLKKFTAGTERAAIEAVRDELGPEALVLSIKRIRQNGFLSFFGRQSVEITAAYEDADASVPAAPAERRATGAPPSGRRTAGAQSASGETAGPLSVGRAGGAPYKTTGETSANGAPAGWLDTFYAALRGAKRAGGAPPGTAGNDPVTRGTANDDPAPERWPDTLYTALRGAKRPGGVPPETVGNNLATRGTANDDPAPERWPDTLYTALRGAKHADGAPPEMLSGSAASGSQPTDVSSKTTGETSAGGAPARWPDTLYTALRGAKHAGGAPPGMLSGSAVSGSQPTDVSSKTTDETSAGGAPARWPDTLYTALRGAKHAGGAPPGTAGNDLATRGTANDDPTAERWPDTLYTALRGVKHAGGAPPGMLSGSVASGSQPTDVLSKTTGETSAGGAPARWPDTLYTALRGAKRPGVAPPGMLSGSAASGSQPMDVLSKTTGETSAGGAPARWPDTLYTALRGAKRAGGAPPETAGNDPATHRTTYNDPAPERWPDTLYTALRGAKRAGGASPETAGNDPATRGTANANPAPPEASSWIIRDLEAKLSGTELLLGRLAGRLSVAEQMLRGAGTRKFENSILQLFYDTLVNNGVLPEIAENLLKDADCADEFENIDISLIAYIVYNSIIGALGAPEPVSLPKSAAGPASRAFFIGPTGVGKTTTIAKISADLILNQKKRVRLITADTYRIAAVEQLKTYAEILGVGVTVVYSAGDLRAEAENAPEAADVVLIDTAGRSHRNAKEMDELKELLEAAPESEKFLVLSLNMRREDMLAVVDAYSAAGDFRLIFTKLDETDRVGEILNVCRLTGRKLAYVTNGQNVPDDIETARPEALAKALLGIGGGAA